MQAISEQLLDRRTRTLSATTGDEHSVKDDQESDQASGDEGLISSQMATDIVGPTRPFESSQAELQCCRM